MGGVTASSILGVSGGGVVGGVAASVGVVAGVSGSGGGAGEAEGEMGGVAGEGEVQRSTAMRGVARGI